MRSLSLFVIGLVFGGGLGFLVAAANGIALDGHDHGDHDHAAAAGHDHATHDHSRVTDLPAGPDAPSVGLTATPDPVSGWNLKVTVENFRFAPEHASAPAQPGEGHAHLYVNGEKVARLYGPWFHLSGAQPGDKVTVTLNGNDHSGLSVDGVPVEASAILGQ
ncbi:hypothetical protein [Jhaorihella thermophila]|uniref:Copper(I)-binding protein n=1 Tax=Jhaorihella thermophila TaxID=488547 RepID=A0A1H5YST8_9RHOB|nr:hypothetical protein [Jhaorihella thermophila]SEG27064.1 hypothetical protein SAMN05421751_12221 [Jhaorihella thermophila]